MRLPKLVISTVVLASFVFVFIGNTLYAADCVPAAERKVECGGIAITDVSKSYQCLPNSNEPNISQTYKSQCEGLGGVYGEGANQFETCEGPLYACCMLPVCAEGGTSPGSSNEPKPVPQTGSTAEWNYGGNSGGLQLVSCTKSGDCTIQDMVQQGIYFADFLIGLSGALFLIAFIWGGTMYLLSFGRDSWVTKGRDAMVKSAIGIVFIMLAWTIVTYVASSLGYTKI